MNINDALQRMVEKSGKSKSGISVELGKSRNFITSSITQASGRGTVWNPQTDTLLNIAKLCGYEVVLLGHGEEIELG